jgi:hypothetical protein
MVDRPVRVWGGFIRETGKKGEPQKRVFGCARPAGKKPSIQAEGRIACVHKETLGFFGRFFYS